MKDLFDAVETLSLVASSTPFVGKRLEKTRDGAFGVGRVNENVNWNQYRECEAMFLRKDGGCIGASGEPLYFDNIGERQDKSLFAKFDASIVKMWYADDILYALVTRVRSVPLSRLRGTGKIFSPYAAEMVATWWDSSEDVYRGKRSLFNLRGSEWVSTAGVQFLSAQSYLKFDDVRAIGLRAKVDGDESGRCEEDSFAICMAASIAFTRDLLWRVEICLPSGMSISFTTNAIGCHEAYTNRDKVGDRREALRHWVKQHYRTVSRVNDAGEEDAKEVFVRQHLRGKVPFRWCGLDCNVVVSPFDLRRNERFKNERAAIAKRPSNAEAVQ